jgi:hypothetical protein
MSCTWTDIKYIQHEPPVILDYAISRDQLKDKRIRIV